jgi:hypothetical protein
MGSVDIFNIVLEAIPITTLVLGIVSTTLLTTVIRSYTREDSKIFTSRRISGVVSLVMTFLLLDFDVLEWKTFVFRLLFIWGTSILFYDHVGGKWLISKFIKPFVNKMVYNTTRVDDNRGSVDFLNGDKDL